MVTHLMLNSFFPIKGVALKPWHKTPLEHMQHLEMVPSSFSSPDTPYSKASPLSHIRLQGAMPSSASLYHSNLIWEKPSFCYEQYFPTCSFRGARGKDDLALLLFLKPVLDQYPISQIFAYHCMLRSWQTVLRNRWLEQQQRSKSKWLDFQRFERKLTQGSFILANNPGKMAPAPKSSSSMLAAT